jgi:hypothetical protein
MHTFEAYLKSSVELASGYNAAMSIAGSNMELLAALGAVTLLAIALALVAGFNRGVALYLITIIAVPFLVSLKHAVVRQDSHIVYIFSFVAVAIGLVALATTLDGRRTYILAAILFTLGVLCFSYTVELGTRNAIIAVTGANAPAFASTALQFHDLRQELFAQGLESSTVSSIIEPQIKAIVQNQPVASLSVAYSNALLENLNLVLYPVLQRYSAYTPYLDQLNADWVREKGPRFLIFDGKSFDHRHPWTETPATWVEVYRWYNTRILGTYNLLLERRAFPRFTRFETLGHQRLASDGQLRIPSSSQPVFWTMQCSLTTGGKLRGALFRIDEVTMTVEKNHGLSDRFRVVPAVLGSPSMGNYLPDDLAEFAAVFEPSGEKEFSVDKLTFAGPGMHAYSPDCDVELLRPNL